MEEVKKPWFKFYGCVPETLDYPDCTMAEAVENVAKKYPDYIAYDFMGKKTTYANAVKDIIAAAKALKALGAAGQQQLKNFPHLFFVSGLLAQGLERIVGALALIPL